MPTQVLNTQNLIDAKLRTEPFRWAPLRESFVSREIADELRRTFPTDGFGRKQRGKRHVAHPMCSSAGARARAPARFTKVSRPGCPRTQNAWRIPTSTAPFPDPPSMALPTV